MKHSQVAIHERESCLTASLEREFASHPEINFRWLPYSADFFRFLETRPCQLAIIDCQKLSTDDISNLLNRSEKLPILAISARDDFEFECLLRELGIVSVFPVGTDLHRIVCTIRNLLDP